MSTLNQPLFLVRKVGTEEYESGYGHHAVPKLYTRNSANSVMGQKNKRAIMHGWSTRWEVVPVSVKVELA